MNCLACLMVLAIFFLYSKVCSLLSMTSFNVNDNTSSTFAFWPIRPSEESFFSSWLLSFSDCAVFVVIRFLAWLVKFLSMELIFHISYFLFKPYSLTSSCSLRILSFCHGCDGVENFFLCFFGLPILH